VHNVQAAARTGLQTVNCHSCMHQKLIERFELFAADPAAEEFDAALLVNCAVDSSADLAEVQIQTRKLVETCTNRDAPWVYLREAGFGGDPAASDVVVASCLDKLLETKRGLPISLGVLLIHLARKLGHRSVGVNFPGHFLVRVGKKLIDPYRMSETSEADCLVELGDMAGAGDHFVAASPEEVALRMLNNLKHQYANDGEWFRTLEMLDYQLALTPDNPHLYVERGQYWLRLGGVTAAREAFHQVLQLVPRGDLAEYASSRLQDLKGQNEVLH